jgi:dTMP kinase
MRKGMFVVFEGGEGSGKTSVISRLSLVFNAIGQEVVRTREPGGTPYAEEIRQRLLADEAKDMPFAEQFELFWEARQHHVENLVRPALERDALVLCDRFDASTWAYQIVLHDHLDMAHLFWEKRRECCGEYVPDLYVYLDVDPRIGLQRVANRGEKRTHFDGRDIAYHHRIREAYRNFFNLPEVKDSARIINANESFDVVELTVARVVGDALRKDAYDRLA